LRSSVKSKDAFKVRMAGMPWKAFNTTSFHQSFMFHHVAGGNYWCGIHPQSRLAPGDVRMRDACTTRFQKRNLDPCV
jgi:hypothetical protein